MQANKNVNDIIITY